MIRGIPLERWHEIGHAWTHQPHLSRREIALDLGVPEHAVETTLRRLGYDKRATQDRIITEIGERLRRGEIETLQEAGELVGMSHFGVRQALHRLGLSRCIVRRPYPNRKVNPAEALRMARSGMKIRAIAKHFGVTPEAVCGSLRRNTAYYEARDAARHDRPTPPDEIRARMLADGMKPAWVESALARARG